jgi:predicted metal-dependent hydrolase
VSRIARSLARERAAEAPRELLLDGQALAYRLIRSPRLSVAIHVGPDGVAVRAPRRAALADIEAFLRRKARWIRTRLAACRAPAAPFIWEEGASLPILGEEVRLVTNAPGVSGITRDRPALLIGDPARARRSGRAPEFAPAERLRERVLAWLREQALAHYARRVQKFAGALCVPLPALKLSNAATQWGSCIRGRDGPRVLLHWKLYLLPPHLVDYVVAHELAHLRELNHSPRFWSVVSRVYPDPVAARRELHRRGRALPQL